MKENHQYIQSWENSRINKTYMFQFINSYISNFVYIFYYQDYAELQKNLIIVMVGKQVFFNTLEYFLLKCQVGRKINKVDRLFEQHNAKTLSKSQELNKTNKEIALEEEDLRLHQNIEKQL